MAELQYVRSLFVTLRRSYAGTPAPHRRVLQALGLTQRHQCVEKPNSPMIRGMLEKVPHLITIETDRMYYLKCMKEYHEQQCRPPLVLHHDPPPDSLAAERQPHRTAFAKQQLEEHVLGVGLDGTAPRRRSPPRAARYFQEQRRQWRAKVLTEQGVFSSQAVRQHQQDVERSYRRYGRDPP